MACSKASSRPRHLQIERDLHEDRDTAIDGIQVAVGDRQFGRIRPSQGGVVKASPPGITGTGGLLALIALGFLTVPAAAQWSGGVGDQTSRPAPYEGEFRQRYPETEALFNAFDYGSAVLFERLLTEPNPLVERLEVEIYGKLAGQVLRNAPRVPTPVQKMIPNYARLAPRANPIVTWARMLRRQIYDIYADDRITDKVVAVDEAVEHYPLAVRSRLAADAEVDGHHGRPALLEGVQRALPEDEGTVLGVQLVTDGSARPVDGLLDASGEAGRNSRDGREIPGDARGSAA